MKTTTPSGGFSTAESAAMKDRAKELKAQAGESDGQGDVLAKIHEMPDEDQALATRFHQLVQEVAPNLAPRTWYGMPAYATSGKNGKVVCFFQSAGKMNTRYNVVGFSDTARLDDGSMWPTSFAIRSWDSTVEKTMRALVTKAVSSYP